MGKARPRVDIKIEHVSYGKRPRLCFEAKRLNSATGHTLKKYLGSDGLGCFLTGKYPATHGEAGMLGYVQSGETDEWHKRLKQQLASQGATETFRCSLPLHTCESKHSLSTSGVITIHHILLPFVQRSQN